MPQVVAIACRRDWWIAQIDRRWSWLAVGFLVFMWVSSIPAQDKNYLEMPLDPNCTDWYKLDRQQYLPFNDMLSGAQPLNTQTFDAFFNDTVFPLLTQWSDRTIQGKQGSPLIEGPPKGGIAAVRAAFKTKYANKATAAAAHQELNKITLEKMLAIAGDHYHPVVRANAMLLISELTETSDPASAPWKQALLPLLKVATANDTVDVVRVEALRGLLRHAQAGIDTDTRPQVDEGMLGILRQHTPPAGRTQDGHDWICRRAIDVLSAIGDGGANANGAVVKGLLGAIDDPAASTGIRCAAAAALAKVKNTPPKDFDATPVAKSLGKLAVDCTKQEVDLAAKQFEPIVVDRLKQDLNEISQGLNGGDGKGGIAAWSSDAAYQKLVSLINDQVRNLMTACDKPPSAAFADPVVQMNGQTSTTPIPMDSQKPIATALGAAAESLKNVLEKGEAAPAAGAPLGMN